MFFLAFFSKKRTSKDNVLNKNQLIGEVVIAINIKLWAQLVNSKFKLAPQAIQIADFVSYPKSSA